MAKAKGTFTVVESYENQGDVYGGVAESYDRQTKLSLTQEASAVKKQQSSVKAVKN